MADDRVYEMPLSRGLVALVSAEDWELVAKHRWSASPRAGGYGFTARTQWNEKGVTYRWIMHRLIMAAPAHLEVDHVNGNSLDNRRSNLRLATRSQNARNKFIRKQNTSGFKGVWWDKDSNRWKAYVVCDRKKHYVGTFTDLETAARAYDRAALRLHGEFANLNFGTGCPAVLGIVS